MQVQVHTWRHLCHQFTSAYMIYMSTTHWHTWEGNHGNTANTSTYLYDTQWHDVPSSLPFCPFCLFSSLLQSSELQVLLADLLSKILVSGDLWRFAQLARRLCCNLSHVLVWFRQARQPGVCASWNNRGTHCVMSSWMLASPILIPHFTLHPSLKAQAKLSRDSLRPAHNENVCMNLFLQAFTWIWSYEHSTSKYTYSYQVLIASEEAQENRIPWSKTPSAT